MSLPQPIYTTVESVKVRLANKVIFQKDPSVCEEGELPNALLCQLICDAETQVEQELRGRYAIPFRSFKSKTWDALPDHSKRAIRQVVDMQAVMLVLQTDFGRGSHVDSENYKDPMQTNYDKQIKRLLGMDEEGKLRDRFRFSPPLEDMQLAPGNSEADDGYKGTVINTDASIDDAADYAAGQINDPSERFFITGTARNRRY